MKIAMNSMPMSDGRRDSDSRLPMTLALVAAACFAGSVWGFGAAVEGYSQLVHPVSILGASGIPHADAFNLVGFMLPGLLMIAVAAHLCRRVAMMGALGRIGGWITLFSTMAFAALGVFALQPGDSEATSSRLHIACWSLWWLTTATGGVLLSIAARRPLATPAWRVAGAIVALLVPWCCLAAPAALGFALSERIAFALWFGWWLLATLRLRRRVGQP